MARVTLEEAQKIIESNRKRTNLLIEEYQNTSVANVDDVKFKNLSEHTQRLIANALNEEETYMRARLLNETLVSSAFGTTPENVLKIITLGIANSIRPMAFYEHPLSTMNDAFYWIHKERETSKRDGVAGEKLFENPRRRYAGESAEIDTTGTGATQYDIDTGYSIIMPNKVMILLDDVLVAYDNGNGGLVPVSTPNAINITSGAYNEAIYSTGHVKVEFASAVAGPSVIKVIVHWDSEDKTLFDTHLGTVSMSVEKKTFNPRQIPLGYEFTDLTALQLGTTGVTDVHKTLVTTAGEEHAMAKDYRAIQLANNIANTNQQYTWNGDFGAEGEISAVEHSKNILSRIDDIRGDIQNELKRGGVNKIIAGSQALTYLRKTGMFQNDNSMAQEGIYKAGSINGMEVFFVPQMDGVLEPNEMLVSFKNARIQEDCPLIFGTLTELQAELRTPDLRTAGTLATVEDQMILEKKFIRKLTIQNYS